MGWLHEIWCDLLQFGRHHVSVLVLRTGTSVTSGNTRERALFRRPHNLMMFGSLGVLFTFLVATLLQARDVQSFNFEVEKRIRERLDFFLSGPVDTASVLSKFRRNDGFPNNMDAADRDLFLALAYSVTQPLVYFGLEDGTCPG